MKVIKLQNCTESKDSMFKAFVNGEKHILSRYSNKIQVDDDKPFSIRVRYFWDGSSEYTFEPKDDMVLQVSISQTAAKRYDYLHAAASLGFVFHFVLFYFGIANFLNYLGFLWFLCFAAAAVIMRKKHFFVIKDISKVDS